MAMLTDLERVVVMMDFAQARRHLKFDFKVKLSFWQQLPWILFGLAHCDLTIARWCGQRSLALWAAAGDDVEHHPLALLLCVPGTIGYDQMILFIGGRLLQSLEYLESIVARFFFTSVTERWVESLHAKVASGVAYEVLNKTILTSHWANSLCGYSVVVLVSPSGVYICSDRL
jgi:hypothetical protein